MRRNYQKQNKKVYKKKPKKIIPPAISIRFIHWDSDKGVITGISHKPYLYTIDKKKMTFLEKTDLTKTLLIELVSNDKTSIAVINKLYNKIPKTKNQLKELHLRCSDELLKNKIPSKLSYTKVKDMHNDLVRVMKKEQKHVNWQN